MRRRLAGPTTSCQDERTWKGGDLLGECQRPSLAFHSPPFLPLAQNGPEPFNSVALGVSFFPTLPGPGLPLLVFSEPAARHQGAQPEGGVFGQSGNPDSPSLVLQVLTNHCLQTNKQRKQ